MKNNAIHVIDLDFEIMCDALHLNVESIKISKVMMNKM